MTHEECLMWLNDHLDRDVTASLMVERGDYGVPVMSIEGGLRHWSAEAPETAQWRMRAGRSEDIAGLYTIGDPGASIDLSERWLEEAAGLNVNGDLVIELAENVSLTVVVAVTQAEQDALLRERT